jgi:hypothetical protein
VILNIGSIECIAKAICVLFLLTKSSFFAWSSHILSVIPTDSLPDILTFCLAQIEVNPNLFGFLVLCSLITHINLPRTVFDRAALDPTDPIWQFWLLLLALTGDSSLARPIAILLASHLTTVQQGEVIVFL